MDIVLGVSMAPDSVQMVLLQGQNADAAKDKASSQSQEVRRKWQAHAAEVRANIEKKKAEHDVKEAEKSAKMALAYALDAIDFAQAAFDQAEYAALEALYAQAVADSRARPR